MNAISFSRSSSLSHLDVDVSMFMDTSQDFEPSQGGGVRWVASQSTNPALQALMREAERDRRTRPSTPVDEPTSWTYPLTSTITSTSLSSSVLSVWHSSAHNSTDPSYPPGSSSSASSSSLAPGASEPCVSRHAPPLSTAQRRPLASSTSSANQPSRHSARPRSSSHSTALSKPNTSKGKYIPRDDEPEAADFIELLKVTSKTVDTNSVLKEQKVRADGKKKEREQSLEKSGSDGRTPNSDVNHSSAHHLTKTTSVSAIYPVTSSASAPDQTLTKSLSAHKPESRGRTLVKESGTGVSSVHSVSGKSIPTPLPSPNLNCNPKPVLTHRLSAGISNSSNSTTARKTSSPGSASQGGDTAMRDVIDLTEADTEWEEPISGPISRTDTTMSMDLDAEESDSGMDVSFYRPEPPPRARISAAPKSKPQPNAAPRPAAPTQRTRTGPPPLGMRRAPQFQPSQYSSTQGSKGGALPRFKPPLITNSGGTMNRNGNGGGMKPATTSSAKPAPRNDVAKTPVAESSRAIPKDPDSSFDMSFELDAEALEEAMKAYD